MIPTMHFQILINIGHINPIICIIDVLPPFRLGAFSSSFLMTSFTSFSVTSLVCNAASKLNHWDSSQNNTSCYQLTTKNVNCKRVTKTSTVGTGLVISNKMYLLKFESKIVQFEPLVSLCSFNSHLCKKWFFLVEKKASLHKKF